jgi:hypothetical protein
VFQNIYSHLFTTLQTTPPYHFSIFTDFSEQNETTCTAIGGCTHGSTMSLQAIYESFLGNPNAAGLAETASIHYITTLTTISNAEPIATHLQKQNKSVVKKKAETVISAIEGPSALSLEVETTLEFISGGGAYLPGLENFVTDKVATFPAVSPPEL